MSFPPTTGVDPHVAPGEGLKEVEVAGDEVRGIRGPKDTRCISELLLAARSGGERLYCGVRAAQEKPRRAHARPTLNPRPRAIVDVQLGRVRNHVHLQRGATTGDDLSGSPAQPAPSLHLERRRLLSSYSTPRRGRADLCQPVGRPRLFVDAPRLIGLPDAQAAHAVALLAALLQTAECDRR